MRIWIRRAGLITGAGLLVAAGCALLAQPASATPGAGSGSDSLTEATQTYGGGLQQIDETTQPKGQGSGEGDEGDVAQPGPGDPGYRTEPGSGSETDSGAGSTTKRPELGPPKENVIPKPTQRVSPAAGPQATEAESGPVLTNPFVLLGLVLVLALLAGAFVFSRRSSDGGSGRPARPATPDPVEDYEPVASYATPGYTPTAPGSPAGGMTMPGYHQSWDAPPTSTGPVPTGPVPTGAIPVVAASGSYGIPPSIDDDLPPEPPTDVSALVQALEQVAAEGPSDAIRQQIERVLDGDPSRDTLIRSAIKYRDQLEDVNEELRGRLLLALGTVGVREVIADGQVLDGRLHEVLTVEPAPSPELADRVARTVRCGYVDVDRVLRVPAVVVYGGVDTGGHPIVPREEN